jgi:hypothetical protein
MKVPRPFNPANQTRTEEELRILDQVAESAAQMSKSLSVSSIVPKTFNLEINHDKKNQSGVVIIETQEDLNKLVESDFTMSVNVRNARTYKFLRVLISPSLTNVWGENTRSSETTPDVSDIIDSIRSNGTNIIPTYGQFDPVNKTVLLIAGTRRRYATLQSDVLLTMDLFFDEMSERDKLVIMQVENVRKEPDPFLKCRSIARMLDPINGDAIFKDQSQLASFFGVTRVHINHQVVIGRLPAGLVAKIHDRQNVTQERAHKFAQSFFQLEKTDISSFEKFNKELSASESFRFAELAKKLQSYIFTEPKQQARLPKLTGLIKVGESANVYQINDETIAFELPVMDLSNLEELNLIINSFLLKKNL